MLSVTKRIETVTEPRNGYVPLKLFRQNQYDDMQELREISSEDVSLAAIQGTCVDYLTRFMLGAKIEDAFDISIRGALELDEAYENHDESERISKFLSKISGLDELSILCACKAVCYDVAFRRGIGEYRDVDTVDIPVEMISNIIIMVNRCLNFLKDVGPVVDSQMTFEGGYTKLVSTGDGDYLTKDMIIDFKVSQRPFSHKWSLQLLMYYLLGIHSIHNEYKSIKYLCIFNPYKNISYIVDVNDIDDRTKYKVSHEVLGYKMIYYEAQEGAYSNWFQVKGTDKYILDSFVRRVIDKEQFDLSKYDDGIHELSIHEYWSCLCQIDKEYKDKIMPNFSRTDKVKMIKKNGYLMFLSVSSIGTVCVLNGAGVKKASFSVKYYYDNIEQYANAVVSRFSPYWDALRFVSKQIKSLKPSEDALRAHYMTDKKIGLVSGSYSQWYKMYGDRYESSGRIHGCIVDIDDFNHIYLNPYDGTVVPYYAITMYDKDVYSNVKSLIAAKRPELLESTKHIADKSTELVAVDNKSRNNLSIIKSDDSIDEKTVKVYSHEMYDISNRLLPLQRIYDFKLIQAWYDNVLSHALPNKVVKRKNKSASDYIGQSIMQKSKMNATIIRYRSYNDIDVEFEDKTIVEHTTITKWKHGTIVRANVALTQKEEIVKKDINSITDELYERKIKTGSRSFDMQGKKYSIVVSDLEKKGFTNIRLQRSDDLITGFVNKQGTIKSISIGGSSVFNDDSFFDPEEQVIIVVNTFKGKGYRDITEIAK